MNPPYWISCESQALASDATQTSRRRESCAVQRSLLPATTIPPVLGPVDHVGYLAADLEASVAEFTELLGALIVRRFERPQYSLQGV
jgi:hypothetical protein